MPETFPIPSGQIVWLVGQLHVSANDTDVVRFFAPRMKNRPAFTRAIRRAVYRYAIQQHHGNQGFYWAVETGRI
jgi:hypothetical protein